MATLVLVDKYFAFDNVSFNLFNTFYNPGGSRLYLASGTIPTQTEIDAAGTSFSKWSSQHLVEFITVNETNQDQRKVVFNPLTATAAVSGTVTWFYATEHYNIADPYLVVGTVTNIGGGGDMEISSTTITAGEDISLSHVVFEFPHTYTY